MYLTETDKQTTLTSTREPGLTEGAQLIALQPSYRERENFLKTQQNVCVFSPYTVSVFVLVVFPETINCKEEKR